MTVLNVPTLELRGLRADLLWCYKVVFGLAHVNVNKFFEFSPCHNTRGHKYKLFKHQTTACVQTSGKKLHICSGEQVSFFPEASKNIPHQKPERTIPKLTKKTACGSLPLPLMNGLNWSASQFRTTELFTSQKQAKFVSF